MAIKGKSAQPDLTRLAREILEVFDQVSTAARAALERPFAPDPSSMAAINTLTSQAAMRALSQIGSQARDSYEVLARAPASARVVVSDAGGIQKTYYVCRTMGMLKVANLVNYEAPIGRIASLHPGDVLVLPNGTALTVLARALLHPLRDHSEWDSVNNLVEHERTPTLTVASLLALLKRETDEVSAQDLVDEVMLEERQAANVFEGVRRRIISKMGLRDQPILDKYQDEIFRLPLDSRLLLLGPPGTGKTTTLIKRLAQKVHLESLEADELRVVEQIEAEGGETHANSWVMFTPTDLLRQYVKEAFAREGVPASDRRIRTWNDYRREIARRALGVLKSGAGTGSFVERQSGEALTDRAIRDPVSWYEEFDTWQRSEFMRELDVAADALAEAGNESVAAFGARTKAQLASVRDDVHAALEVLAPNADEAQGISRKLKSLTDEQLKKALNSQLNANKHFLEELAEFLGRDLRQAQSEAEEDDDEDLDEAEIEDEEMLVPSTTRGAAMRAYMRAVRAQARSMASKRTLGRSSRSRRTLEWLGSRTLEKSELEQLGLTLVSRASLRRFVDPVQRFIMGTSRRYRAFRRLRREDASWYTHKRQSPADIEPLELDVVLAVILRNAQTLYASPSVARRIDESPWRALKTVVALRKNQILVDEATDFSPIQLACMASLVHPRTGSFFACGDFNQRLTTWGSRSVAQVKWASSSIDVKRVAIAYRQSKQLSEFALAIVEGAADADATAVAPTQVDSEGVAPALLEGTSDFTEIVGWLAERIRDIEVQMGQLPSTAVLVNFEAEVVPLARALSDALQQANIRAIACTEGQALGQENDVRVFDVQHIKGLEFEAVFYVAIDRLAKREPDLFSKYLYVGATRAATYLGLTCDTSLPAAVASTRHMFVSGWGRVD